MTERAADPTPGALSAAITYLSHRAFPRNREDLALALDDFAKAAVERERERWQSVIHSLCPDAKNNYCRNGMLYDAANKAVGACEWHGHVEGGYT